MVGSAGLLTVTAGAVIAYLSERFPAHIEAIEGVAGVLLLGGLALIGSMLPAGI